jgi:hypothetical protein
MDTHKDKEGVPTLKRICLASKWLRRMCGATNVFPMHEEPYEK